MKEVQVDYYECEICGTAYETREQALACEAAGQPEARYQPHQQVRLADSTFTRVVPATEYTIMSSIIQLKAPAWQEGPAGGPTPGEHMVTYVLQGGPWRLSFVPEAALRPAGG